MTVRRLLTCMAVVVAICLVNVYHHAQVVRYGYQLGRLQEQNSRLAVSLASLEGRVTALASPTRLRGENERQQLGLVGPSQWQDQRSAVAFAQLGEENGRGLLER